jgi:hypothetical protein
MLALGTTPLLCRPSAGIRGHVGFYVLPFNRQVDPQRAYSRIRHNSTQNSPLRSVQARDQQARGDACSRVWAARDRRRECLPWVHPHRGGGGGGCCCQDEAAAAGALSRVHGQGRCPPRRRSRGACPQRRGIPSRHAGRSVSVRRCGRGASSGFSCPRRITCRSSPIQPKQLGRWRRADQIVVPKVRLDAQGSRRAATDRRRDRHDRWRSVVDRRRARSLTPALNCGFPMILPDL